MKRKDILIIAAIVIIIAFGTVFAIYYAINGSSIFEKIGEEDVGDFLGNIITNKNSGASAPYSPDERNEGAGVYASKQSDDIIYLKNKTTGEYNFYILETLIKK